MTASFDPFGNPASGLDSYMKQFLDSLGAESSLILTLIHELGHAVNSAMQENAHAREIHFEASDELRLGREVTGTDITGSQMDSYVVNILNGFGNMPSNHGTSNHVEWFAENFTFYMIERAGRQDLLALDPRTCSAHPLAGKGQLLVDGPSTLVMDKIIQAVDNREQDPVV